MSIASRPFATLRELYREEFGRYRLPDLTRDALAGLTVAAVALPLALAFGVASGATPAAGLVTAILAGLIIGALSGAPYQISDPTGAMSAILVGLATRYGLEGVWAAGALAGLVLLAVGLLRLGRFVAFIPSPVITGFTSGIALIIAIGQVDAWFGTATPPAETALLKLVALVRQPPTPHVLPLALGGLVMAVMVLWPRRWQRVPASLVGLVAATAVASWLGWPVDRIGDIPRRLLLDDRLTLAALPLDAWRGLVAPALSIAALGAIESLLCGAVGSQMTGIRLRANQELIAQGLGNLVIPFFGGVPATAAIARSSVGIKSGGKTRVVSLVHSAALLATVLVGAPLMAAVPLCALAGVLIVTAWRMNEWEAIGFMWRHRLTSAQLKFAVTMLATIALDLTQAILLGVALSAVVFIGRIAALRVEVVAVDPARLRDPLPLAWPDPYAGIRVAYLSGPLFFAAVGTFNEAFARLDDVRVLILSMRGVPLVDTSGLLAMAHLHERLAARGARLLLAAVQPDVQAQLERGGIVAALGRDAMHWGADEAIHAAAVGSAGAAPRP